MKKSAEVAIAQMLASGALTIHVSSDPHLPILIGRFARLHFNRQNPHGNWVARLTPYANANDVVWRRMRTEMKITIPHSESMDLDSRSEGFEERMMHALGYVRNALASAYADDGFDPVTQIAKGQVPSPETEQKSLEEDAALLRQSEIERTIEEADLDVLLRILARRVRALANLSKEIERLKAKNAELDAKIRQYASAAKLIEMARQLPVDVNT